MACGAGGGALRGRGGVAKFPCLPAWYHILFTISSGQLDDDVGQHW